jgi:hypothetical protein
MWQGFASTAYRCRALHGPQRPDRTQVSLLARLLAPVVLASIPALAVQGWNAHALRRARTLEMHAEAQQTAQQAMTILSRTVDGLRQTLLPSPNTQFSGPEIRLHVPPT